MTTEWVSGVLTWKWGHHLRLQVSFGTVIDNTQEHRPLCHHLYSHRSTAFDFLHAVVVAGSVTWCLLGACSLLDLNTPVAMDSGSINIRKDRIELHSAVNVGYVSSPSRLPGRTWAVVLRPAIWSCLYWIWSTEQVSLSHNTYRIAFYVRKVISSHFSNDTCSWLIIVQENAHQARENHQAPTKSIREHCARPSNATAII